MESVRFVSADAHGVRCWSLGMAEMRGMLLVLLSLLHSSTSCGVQKVSVFYGPDPEEALVNSMEFPWVVSLQDSQYTHLAFGCILSEFWVLSIASAVQNRQVPLPLGPAASPGMRVGMALFLAQPGEALKGGFWGTGLFTSSVLALL
ncbi:hypothetical protein P7K49_036459 [Saguinus oedipus]|uniref:Uncharacterized protein n=1 Tax=Saguinus oedipus TaxID=9490 RepID=A0ABQ9TK63_SAGOE|nr:hypothetical protein P7K49_036459 [Saguinus oedipus]